MMVRAAIQLSDEQIARFQADGFLVIEHLMTADLAKRVGDRIEPLFHGQLSGWLKRSGPDATNQ
jgi:hypothetical protein